MPNGLGMPSWADMLGGMRAHSIAPSADDVTHGLETLKYKKTPVVVSRYHAQVWDMDIAHEREDYCKVMLGLMTSIQNAQSAILRHELQPLQNRDGSTTWKRYMEWVDYKLNDTSTTTKRGESGSAEESK